MQPETKGSGTARPEGVAQSHAEKIVATLVKLVRERIPERFGLDPIRDVQVLCPMNRCFRLRNCRTSFVGVGFPSWALPPSCNGSRFSLS